MPTTPISLSNSRGYFGIGIENLQFDCNYGTLFRTASIFGASFLFIIGNKFKKQVSDTTKSFRHIPTICYENFETFYKHVPFGCNLIGVELIKNSTLLKDFKHPQRAIYLLGSENKGLSETAINKCDEIISLPGDYSMNVSVAGSIVLYDRITK